MKQSQFFSKTVRESPRDEISINAQLLERAGFISKFMAGAYVYLPLGLRVLEKINNIIRKKMNGLGAQELLMTSLQPKELWLKTDRWNVLGDIMYRFKDRSEREVGLASTHEEPVTELAKKFIHSYKDLPKAVYQIQTKFRDEPRARSGLIRGREFLMKDLYSFHRDEKDLDKFYEEVKNIYGEIFSECGLEALAIEASGGTFTKAFSHEFQVITSAGEDVVILCKKHKWAQNQEITKLKAGDRCPKGNDILESAKSVEVGNIFKLGTKFSRDLNLLFKDKDGIDKPVVMASYGIGPGRVMGTVVEVSHDQKGIIWPESIAPFKAHLLMFVPKDKNKQKKVLSFAERVYDDLQKNNIEVLFDDRLEVSVGEKFIDADLIGMPWRIIISEKTVNKKMVEVKKRSETDSKIINESALIKMLKK